MYFYCQTIFMKLVLCIDVCISSKHIKFGVNQLSSFEFIKVYMVQVLLIT